MNQEEQVLMQVIVIKVVEILMNFEFHSFLHSHPKWDLKILKSIRPQMDQEEVGEDGKRTLWIVIDDKLLAAAYTMISEDPTIGNTHKSESFGNDWWHTTMSIEIMELEMRRKHTLLW
ncbi:hypothetical protein F511_04210 [Dorcoceras hygrometricum]|uniref:Uncharacterized protein n=1 Tax=Dorcoceras hygrometricum TaxID=472368 RepID=A0A2Z7BIQ7_9LAMI|nr:hypothetical protein F511_04210 [Dorcoceras hygrometricum]